ncbi:mast cell protease 4-like [Dermacentor andersoni]|uniref:mast cell protease 4-like n=1 Tax=Dermacentor andersoni TaxID=34620 RepID=UPI002155A805|nr:mast cell protease 4-like [Dermacentor andersoni]
MARYPKAPVGITLLLFSLASLWPEAQASTFRNYKYCGLSEPVPKIINGSFVSRPQVPWLVHVKLIRRNGKVINCGGSLITRDVVLTAANCLKDGHTLYRKILAYYNSTAPFSGRSLEVTHAIIHKKYRHPSKGYDIALLKLSEPVPKFDRFVRPVCLPKPKQKTRPGRMLLAGFGVAIYYGKKADRVLYYLTRALSDDDCRAALTKQWNHCVHVNKELLMCSKHHTQRMYKEDTGSPVTAYTRKGRKIKSFQYGIVSFFDKTNRGPAPTIQTRVSMYINWISYSLNAMERWDRIVESRSDD